MFVNEDKELGQVGIGTLIVFIAMVLVAAIAAGVLINTAGMLQSQAEATGEESTDLVSERIDVTNSVGIVDDADEGTLESIQVDVTGAAGSEDIDLDETIIQVVGPAGQDNLGLTDDPGDENDVETDIGDIDTGEFGVVDDDGYVGESSDAVLDADNGDFSIIMNPGEYPFADGDPEFEEASVDLTDDWGELEGAAGLHDDISVDIDDGSDLTEEAGVDNLNDLESEIEDEIVSETNYDINIEMEETVDGVDGTYTETIESEEYVDGSIEIDVDADGSNDIEITTTVDAGVEGDDNAFGTSDEATLDIVSPSGATTSVELNVPDIFNNGAGEAVRL